jgi:hypothetical protein
MYFVMVATPHSIYNHAHITYVMISTVSLPSLHTNSHTINLFQTCSWRTFLSLLTPTIINNHEIIRKQPKGSPGRHSHQIFGHQLTVFRDTEQSPNHKHSYISIYRKEQPPLSQSLFKLGDQYLG